MLKPKFDWHTDWLALCGVVSLALIRLLLELVEQVLKSAEALSPAARAASILYFAGVRADERSWLTAVADETFVARYLTHSLLQLFEVGSGRAAERTAAIATDSAAQRSVAEQTRAACSLGMADARRDEQHGGDDDEAKMDFHNLLYTTAIKGSNHSL